MENKTYQARLRTDYKPPEFLAPNVELTFELSDEATVVTSTVHYVRVNVGERTPLKLDGQELELLEVLMDGAPCKYECDGTVLTLDSCPDEFDLTVKNKISPITNSELMGLYKSNGTFCTQNEPQGFRRITYFQDRPDILSAYKVTIIGPDYGCGVLLSNGNLTETGSKDGRRYVVWEDPFPKPCYLFALVAGSFDIVEDKFVTKSGRKVKLLLFVDRGSYERGLWAMQSIKTAMKWDETRFGLEYDLDNFKVVAVDFFNQGAMENKSLNVFNSIYVMVDPETATDTAFYNVESVIGHEYFHNYTGDRVTLRDWFELSLKESLTVFRDQEFSSDVASRVLTRLKAVDVIRGSQFAEDAGPMAHPVRPEEVMEMNNFYTVTIYDKGAEVIRMIHTLIGEDNFRQALHVYLTKFDGQAVTIEDFLSVMEEVSGTDLTQFRRWYTQCGTPRVRASWIYDKEKGQLILTLEQNTPPSVKQQVKEPFYIPVRTGFLDKDGHAVHPAELPTGRVLVLKEQKQEYAFTLPEGVFPVLLEDFSAPVKLEAAYDSAQLTHMLKYSGDAFIKVDSAVRLADRYLHDNLAAAHNGATLPACSDLIAAGKVLLDGIDESTDLHLVNEALQIKPLQTMMESFDKIDLDALIAARKALEDSVAVALEKEYEQVYREIKPKSAKYSVADMGRRALRHTALHMLLVCYLATDRAQQASELCLSHYKKAQNMTEGLAAMRDAVHLKLSCAQEILNDFESRWSEDPLVFDNFFRIQATAPDPESVSVVSRLRKHPPFDRSTPNRIRALPGAMVLQNPTALHRADGAGYQLLGEVVTALNSTNTMMAARILNPVLSYRRFDENRQKHILDLLNKLKNMPDVARSVFEKVDAALKQE